MFQFFGCVLTCGIVDAGHSSSTLKMQHFAWSIFGTQTRAACEKPWADFWSSKNTWSFLFLFQFKSKECEIGLKPQNQLLQKACANVSFCKLRVCFMTTSFQKSQRESVLFIELPVWKSVANTVTSFWIKYFNLYVKLLFFQVRRHWIYLQTWIAHVSS